MSYSNQQMNLFDFSSSTLPQPEYQDFPPELNMFPGIVWDDVGADPGIANSVETDVQGSIETADFYTLDTTDPAANRLGSVTTSTTANESMGMITRSGRRVSVVARDLLAHRPRSKRSTPAKPAKRSNRSGNRESLQLTEPISVFTKDVDVPVKDMEAWVRRSAIERQKEVKEAKGKTPRPMNCFMLYRSAYADRLKAWGKHNNHQEVSKFAGASWAIETQDIQEKYRELAKIERNNHHAAHPNYKFTPSKASFGKKRRNTDDESDDEDEAASGDDARNWSPSGRRTRSRTAVSSCGEHRRSNFPSRMRTLSPGAPVVQPPLAANPFHNYLGVDSTPYFYDNTSEQLSIEHRASERLQPRPYTASSSGGHSASQVVKSALEQSPYYSLLTPATTATAQSADDHLFDGLFYTDPNNTMTQPSHESFGIDPLLFDGQTDLTCQQPLAADNNFFTVTNANVDGSLGATTDASQLDSSFNTGLSFGNWMG